ncbi:MAG: hypothetical protein ACRDXE_08500 [Acidimicrobiales bacterium]
MQITDVMPPDYYARVGKASYATALQSETGIYVPNRLMPGGGPQTVLNVQNGFHPDVKGHSIDLSKTYTSTFLQQALANHV